MPRSNYREIRSAIAQRAPFEGNSMSAEYVDPKHGVGVGYLPAHDREFLLADMHTAATQGIPFYLVRSYGTPIAWAYGVTVRVPEVRYSTTTSKHQSIVRWYLE